MFAVQARKPFPTQNGFENVWDVGSELQDCTAETPKIKRKYEECHQQVSPVAV
jgi:hypothetical protein